MLEVLTLLSKCTRVPRACDDMSLVGQPGLWVAVQADDSVANVTNGAQSLISKMLFYSSSSSVYESHDISVGRISTIETTGIRFKTDMYLGTPAQGDLMYVAYSEGSAAAGNGKLRSVPATTGTFYAVALCEMYNAAGAYIIGETISRQKIVNP